MIRLGCGGLLLICLVGLSSSVRSEEVNSSLFATLSRLEGTWIKPGGDPKRFAIEFELSAANSTLVETWRRHGRSHSLTIYYLAGDQLLVTHYCPQGNQPRLQMSTDSRPENIKFHFKDGSGINAGAAHQVELEIALSNNGEKLQRAEVYRQGDELTRDVLELVRVSND